MPVTAYTPTTDQPITRYQPVLLTAPANTPRIDHDPITGECKGLLVEESRTNLLTYSEQFDNAAWSKWNCNVSKDSAISPDGTLSADLVVPQGPASKYIEQAKIVTPSSTYTGTVYVKAAGYSSFIAYLRTPSNTSGVRAVVNLASKTATGLPMGSSTFVSTSLVDVGNGWFRFAVSATIDSSTVCSLVIYPNTDSIFTADGYSGIYIWGAQLEPGAFPTSYIKTEASQVTRAADNASMTGTNFSSWYRQDAFTLTADVAPIGGTSSHAVSINNGLDQRALALQYCAATGAIRRQAETYVAPTFYSPIPARAELSRGSRTKVAASFKVGGYANNSFDGDIALGAIQIPRLPEHSVLRFGNFYIPGTVAWTGHIRRVTGYPIDLSPTNLQALTL